MNKSIIALLVSLLSIAAFAADTDTSNSTGTSLLSAAGCTQPALVGKGSTQKQRDAFNKAADSYTTCANTFIEHEQQLRVIAVDRKDDAVTHETEKTIANVTKTYMAWATSVEKQQEIIGSKHNSPSTVSAPANDPYAYTAQKMTAGGKPAQTTKGARSTDLDE